MYPEALPYLRCPYEPTQALHLLPEAHAAADGAILTGRLRCTGCGRHYTIRAGVADLLPRYRLPASPTQITNALPLTAWLYERLWRPRALSLLSGVALGYERELPLLTELAAAQRGGLMVDVACSSGLYARHLERARGNAPGHVIGIDHAFPMLRQARKLAQQEGLRISFVRAQAQVLPLADGAATFVAMGGSLNEIGDSRAALQQMRRVMAHDGRCFLMCLVAAERTLGQAVQHMLALGGLEFLPLATLNQRLRGTGLRLRAQWCYGPVALSLLTVAG
ncbi:MAG: class I SAM-dependent methyltransferase [Candidatus Viridilinea halotolerans]|uniref:Class I SAM-dependent methyltransferase n=1 Tax=Candidatus Viridilinea halotolerans TaxID=2491704 RepID=A0A426TTW4_9CHLR|nr:MAG: class I SAM-dependent methyltransferase [Candidatus Viridilinea halotolerans]